MALTLTFRSVAGTVNPVSIPVHSDAVQISTAPVLPSGVVLRTLNAHPDERGAFTEIFREHWNDGPSPVQWNLVRSGANVFRGVHVHVRHSDYLVLVEGRATIGLVDLRPGSDTLGVAVTLRLSSELLQSLVIPPGVAHGFLFEEASIHVYAVSDYWDPDDELGCRWDDPELELDWPERSPILSARDADLPSLAVLRAQLRDALRTT